MARNPRRSDYPGTNGAHRLFPLWYIHPAPANSDISLTAWRLASGFGGAPIGRLRSLLRHLRDPQIIARLYKRILDTLSHTPCSGPSPDFVIPSYIGDWDANLSHDLVDSLAKHLFGWKSVQSVRVRYAVAAYCQVRPCSCKSHDAMKSNITSRTGLLRSGRRRTAVCGSGESIRSRHPRALSPRGAPTPVGPQGCIERYDI